METRKYEQKVNNPKTPPKVNDNYTFVDGIWIYSKSGHWYKPNFQDDLREVTRVVTHADNAFIPCIDELERETYINTNEVECVTKITEDK
ncbi:hypothetical protein NGH74_13800 [Staphylococcus pseudoxylosus]|uniref:hypothetical protein n=1 Tax=Staphylococcus pseudoxylosus TaxID=2282419 RepID=UPI002DBAA804|nr:hypothetical protein [Staphylococcus pseudoxylosus]MEB8088234.1 hypothetical protein [Staphylococcus pseudoxylosus]